jgi:phosphohistidine swiveling domain-containing protein
LQRFKRLADITERDCPLVGGKAFNCGRLRQAGFPVPDGLAIPAGVTDDQVRQLAFDPWLDTVSSGTLFAVRSSGIGEDSAGHSFAGMHDTQLNVNRERLVDAVLACRRSAVSPAALAYRNARNIAADDGPIGVLVQQMVAATVSGVAFTVNPITGADEIVINAGRGLGEALVSGQIDPDEYRIRKSDGGLVATRLGAPLSSADMAPAAALSDTQLSTLTALIVWIERHYSAPQDVEWCYDGRGFWIVQSRPVTAVRKASSPAGDVPAATRQDRAASLDVEWTRANLVEVLPDQLSPQALKIYVDALDRGERQFFGRLMAPESELGPIIKAFHGRLYFNLSQLRYVTETVGAAPADTLRSLGHPEEIRPEDEIARRPPLGRLVRALPDLLRLVLNSLRAGSIFREHQRHTDEILARLASDPAALSDREIIAILDWWLASIPPAMKAVLVMSGVQMHEDVLRKACKATGFSYDRLVYPQLAAGARSVSTQQAVDLVALAADARHEPAVAGYLRDAADGFAGYRNALAGTAFLGRFDRFLEQYGHRGRYESDWALPRLREQPAPALFAIKSHLDGPPQDSALLAERHQVKAVNAWREFEARLSLWQRWTLLPRVRSTMRRLKQQYLWREQVRSDLTRVVARIRDFHLVLADRFVQRAWIDSRDDYFLLTVDEVKRAALEPSRGPALRAMAAARASQLAAERGLHMPLIMRESELPALIAGGPKATGSTVNGDALTGLCVSPGSVEGVVVVMRDPAEFSAMTRGAILVAPATDPSWTPLFTLASGVIVEVGGMLSHASTIAREYGLPALANVKDATRILKTGDRVRLDASAGRVIR